MYADVLIGLQWGDEGKGKIVDYLAPQYDIVARFQGGPNAGHTLKWDQQTYVLHTIPSGIFRDGVLNIIGNGVVIDPGTFLREIRQLQALGVPILDRLRISYKAHLILPTHQLLDAASEAKKGEQKIGSTLRGIGPTYMDKTGRNGIRVGDILQPGFKEKVAFLEEKHRGILETYGYEGWITPEQEHKFWEGIELLREMPLSNVEYDLFEAMNAGKKVLAEGAQGSLLDNDFGTYPFVTSSNTISSAACTGLGIAPTRIREVIGITKAYATRVGSGPFPTELNNETGEYIRQQGKEFGSTTGRPRRCGWLDLPILRYSHIISGVTQLMLTKIDVLNTLPQLDICTAYQIGSQKTADLPFDLCHTEVVPIYQRFEGWMQDLAPFRNYEELPEPARQYIEFIEQFTGIPVSCISNGPGREELILHHHTIPAV